MRAALIAAALAIGLVAWPGLAQQDAVGDAFASMLRDPAGAEKIFRTGATAQAKIGLAMVLRLASADPGRHESEIKQLLAAVAADTDGDMQPVDLSAGYDGSLESLVPFIQAAAGPVNLPCGLFERYPPLIKVLAGYFYSSRDNSLPRAECSQADYPIPASVDAFEEAVSAYDGGAFDRCTGTMRSGYARASIMASVERQVLPRALLHDTLTGDEMPEWARLDRFPLQRWSYQGAWNRAAYLRLREQFTKARLDLAGYYRRRFGLAEDESLQAAHIGLWLGLEVWTWQVQPVPSPLAVAIMDEAASPALAEPLAKGEPLDKLPEPALSLAVARPEAIGPLLAAHADVNAKNAFGKTPLMTAAQFDQIESVRQLLQAGADVNATTHAPKDIAGNSPKVANDPSSGCGDYAIAHGSRSALMYAAANASSDVIKALLAAGADITKRDSQGLTALDYLLGKGPVPANPRLMGAELSAATELLSH
jgi:F0F1-type ATP synthase membrane subunit c/vacuolar-type H+-ATPase subunit K